MKLSEELKQMSYCYCNLPLSGSGVHLPPDIPLPPIPRDDTMTSHDIEQRDEALSAIGLSGAIAKPPKSKKKTKEEKKLKDEEARQELLQHLGMGECENKLSPRDKKKPLRPPRSPKVKRTDLSEKEIKLRNDALALMGLSGEDSKLPKKVREAMKTQTTLSQISSQPPPLPATPIPGTDPPPLPMRGVQNCPFGTIPPQLLPSAPSPTLPPTLPPSAPSFDGTLSGTITPPPPPPLSTLPKTKPPRDSTLPLPPPSTLPPGDSTLPPPLPTAPIPGTLPKSIEEDHVIIYETEEEIPVSSSSLNVAAFIRSDSLRGMLPEEVELNVDVSVSEDSSSADTSRSSTMDHHITADATVLSNQVELPDEVAGEVKDEVEEETPVTLSQPDGGGVTPGEGDPGLSEDAAEKRMTNYANIQSDETYNNIESEDHINGTARGSFADGDLFSVAPSGWDAGHFDESLPKIAENNDLYCNVDPPQQQQPSDDVTKQSLTSQMSAGGKSTSPLLNIALRPTSMYDPDQSLFEGGDHVTSVSQCDDIYENQPSNVSSNMSSPVNPPPPATLTTKDKLLAEGFRETDVQRAVDIVGENEEMARKILQSFVARN